MACKSPLIRDRTALDGQDETRRESVSDSEGGRVSTCPPVHSPLVHGLRMPSGLHIGCRDSGTGDAQSVSVNTICTTDSPTTYRISETTPRVRSEPRCVIHPCRKANAKASSK